MDSELDRRFSCLVTCHGCVLSLLVARRLCGCPYFRFPTSSLSSIAPACTAAESLGMSAYCTCDHVRSYCETFVIHLTLLAYGLQSKRDADTRSPRCDPRTHHNCTPSPFYPDRISCMFCVLRNKTGPIAPPPTPSTPSKSTPPTSFSAVDPSCSSSTSSPISVKPLRQRRPRNPLGIGQHPSEDTKLPQEITSARRYRNFQSYPRKMSLVKARYHPFLFAMMTLSAMAELGLTAFLIGAGNENKTWPSERYHSL